MNDAKREWFDTDYYKVIGVKSTATQKEITSAYRTLARKYHPDANPDDPAAEEQFKKISAAYDVIGDEDRRKQYDQVRRMGPLGGAFGAGAGGPGGFGGGAPGGWDFEGMGDISDLLGGLFGAGGAQTRQRAQKGRDHEAKLRLTFEEAIQGLTTEVQINGGRSLKVRIPAGVDNGQRIRLKGKGGAGAAGGPAGDLFVIISVEEHRVFGRSGSNLTIDVPITFPEAALGTDVAVPTWSGQTVTLRVPPGTQSGRKFRVKNEGITAGKKSGDLLVTVEIKVPTNLSGAQEKALAAYADLSTESPRVHLEQ